MALGGVSPLEFWWLLFKGAFGDTLGELKETAQGYKSMFDAASFEVNNTLREAAQFDHESPNIPDELPESEPKFIPFDIGLPDTEAQEQ